MGAVGGSGALPRAGAGAKVVPQRRRSRLFQKYVVIFVALVSGALVSSGLIELFFSYEENRTAQIALQREKASTAAVTIEQFVRETERGIGSTIPPPWAAETVPPEQRQADYRRLLRQIPAVTEIVYLDGDGREQLRVSRLATNAVASNADHAAEPQFQQSRAGRTYFGPVYFRNESEPYMTIAIGEAGPEAGVTAAEVSLKLMWDVVARLRIGRGGYAYVVDDSGRLIAHPDISLVLQQTDLSGLPQVLAARAPPPLPDEAADEAAIAESLAGRRVLTAHQTIVPPGWAVFVEQPLEEAFAPVAASLLRTAVLLCLGLALSVLASLLLARKMVTPIQALQAGASRIGGGAQEQRIEVRTGDELEALAEEFNRMTARLHESYATLEQKVEERTRDLATALAQLEVASQHKTELLSTVSHELRTPLGAIKGYATALLRFGPRIRSAERREFLESIDRAADRLATLIEDLLLAQRLEAGALPIHPEPVDVAALANEVVGELAPRASVHAFVCAVPPALPPARGDPRRVRQVLLNLLDNAVKYSPEGGEVRVAAEARNGELVVTVCDQGIGIPAEELARVFERFHRVESDLTRATRGTGLGLAICQGIVQAQGGRIGVESAGPGRGSAFWFTLPRWEEP